MDTNPADTNSDKEEYPSKTLLDFIPLDRASSWIFALGSFLLIVIAFGTFIYILSAFFTAVSEDIPKAAAGYSDNQIYYYYSRVGKNIGVAINLLYCLLAVAFLVWKYKAYKNLYTLNTGRLEYSPGWAVFGYFFPLADFFIPYRIMREIWRAGSHKHIDNVSWKESSVGVLLPLWWILFIANIVLTYAAYYFTSSSAFQHGIVYEYQLFYALSYITGIAGIITLMILVRTISDRQMVKHERLMNESGIPWEKYYSAMPVRLSVYQYMGKGWIPVAVYGLAVFIFLSYSHVPEINGRVRAASGDETSYIRLKIYDEDEFLYMYTDIDVDDEFTIEDFTPGNYHFYFLDSPVDGTINYCDTVMFIGRKDYFLNVQLNKNIPADTATPLAYLQYDWDVADYDIWVDDVILFSNGELDDSLKGFEEALDALRAEYGFATMPIEDEDDPYTMRMADSYNSCVEEYLGGINGADWEESFYADVDSLMLAVHNFEPLDWDEFGEFLKDKYKLASGNAAVKFDIDPEGNIIHWAIWSNNIPDLADMLARDLYRVKFDPCDCEEERKMSLALNYDK